MLYRIHTMDEVGVDMSEILHYPYILEEFDEPVIKSILSQMTPDNMIIIYTSKKNEEVADQTEQIYNTKFACDQISQELAESLTTANFNDIETELGLENPPKFAMPPLNNYIPYNCEVLKSSEKQEFTQIDMGSYENCTLWFKQDDTFEQPDLNVKVLLSTDDLNHRTDTRSKLFK